MAVSRTLKRVLGLALMMSVLLPALPASGRVMFGAYVNPNARWGDEAEHRREVRALEADLGRRLAINQRFYNWDNVFPTRMDRWDVRNKRAPMITWEPRGIPLNRVVKGRYDGMLRRRARAVKAIGGRVFIRFAHEMNGDWYSWSRKPRAYKAAWRRIVTIFRQVGATNVEWIWAPNWVSVPATRDNHWAKYYPGHQYVDWVGVSGFNDARKVPWRTFARIFRGIYNAYSSRKPIFIAETGSREEGGDKGEWIRRARRKMLREWPRIRAFVWHHVGKWRLNTSPRAWRAARDMARARYFRAWAVRQG